MVKKASRGVFSCFGRTGCACWLFLLAMIQSDEYWVHVLAVVVMPCVIRMAGGGGDSADVGGGGGGGGAAGWAHASAA